MAYPRTKPRDWKKAVAVAWCVVLGRSIPQAAESTGVGESTIRDWIVSPWWDEAYAEARAKVPEAFAQRALGALDRGLCEGDQATARYVADRVVPEMLPPAIRTENKTDAKVEIEIAFVGKGKVSK